MPVFTSGQTNDAPSTLSHGWHPAFLYGIRTEPIPPYFTRSLEKDTHEWHWYCAIWQTTQAMGLGEEPELRQLSTTRTWTPERMSAKGDKLSASKAYVWTCSLLGRTPEPGETVTLDDKLPLPVLVNVERKPGSQYIRLPELMAWPANASEWPMPQGPPACIAAAIAVLPAPIAEPPRPQATAPTQPPQAPQVASAPPAPVPPGQPPGMTQWARPVAPAQPPLPGTGSRAYHEDIPF